MEIKIAEEAGEFAENKDLARTLRQEVIQPVVEKGENITLDFQGVNLSTQSFMHALLSELIRSQGADVLDLVVFKNCNTTIKGLINIVVEYSQDSIESL